MKSLIFAVVLLMIGSFSLPVLAQQQDLQEIMNATNALGARQNDLLGEKRRGRDRIAIHIRWIVGDPRSAIRVQARARRHTEALSRDH